MELVEMRKNLLVNLQDLNLNSELVSFAILLINELVFERNFRKNCCNDYAENSDEVENEIFIRSIVEYFYSENLENSFDVALSKIKKIVEKGTRKKKLKKKSTKIFQSTKIMLELKDRLQSIKTKKNRIRSKEKAKEASDVIMKGIEKHPLLKHMNSEFLSKEKNVRKQKSDKIEKLSKTMKRKLLQKKTETINEQKILDKITNIGILLGLEKK